MNSAQRVSLEAERLENRAMQLHRRLAEDDVPQRELKDIDEELTQVLERLKELQHQIFTGSSELEQAAAAGPFDPMRPASLDPGGSGSGQSAQADGSAAALSAQGALSALSEASQREARALTKAAGSGGVPLGQQLLAAMRRNLEPILAEQLEGQDSPFQPPTLISSAVEKTLRQHMAKVKREMDEKAEEDRSSLPQEMGRALVELMRELTTQQRRDLPKGGVERLNELERLNSAVQAGDQFSKALWRASAQQGRRVTVRLGGEGGEMVEIAVTVQTTFDRLKTIACKYWRVDPYKYVMSDQYEVQFMGHMPVLEGLQISPAGTRLQLNPLYNIERAKKSLGKELVEAESRGIDLKKLISDANAKVKVEKGAGEDDSDDEDSEEEDEEVKVAMFGFGDGKMTRWEMLWGVGQTTILIILLYFSAALRLDMVDTKRLCTSLENAFADEPFKEKRPSGTKGSIKSFRTINAFSQYSQWLHEVFPKVLFGLSAHKELQKPPPTDEERLDYPAVITGHTVLLGGLRMLQRRSKTADKDRCSAAPFISTTRHPYPHSSLTSMIDPAIIKKRTGRDVDVFSQSDLSAGISDTFDSLDYGDVSLCYSATEEDTDSYGPLAPGISTTSALYQKYASIELPETRCLPQCTHKGKPGLTSAFEYHTVEELGLPFSLRRQSFHNGGFAITLPGNTTRRHWNTLMSADLEEVWLDRQTRSVDIDLHLYNLQTDYVASVQVTANFDVSGRISTTTSCVALSMAPFTFVSIIPEGLCLLYLAFRGALLAARLFKKRKPEPGEKPVKCVITIELVAHLITTTVGLYAAFVRGNFIISKLDFEATLRADQPWPPPYSGSIGALKSLLLTSSTLYAWALLTCTLRFALYYSIVSKKLYVLRLTISRASKRLIPSLFFVIMTLVAFAIGGNQLFSNTSYQWRSPQASIGTTLYLLRRPFGMPWEEMKQNSLIWPMDSDEPSIMMICFLLAFTCTTIWVMANLYKAVIVIEYSTVMREYQNRQPGDLKDDPWPSFSPFVFFRKQKDRYKDHRFRSRVKAGREREFQAKLAEQKKKQKDLKARIRAAGGGLGGSGIEPESKNFLESMTNKFEKATGIDLDGDGDVGLMGHDNKGEAPAAGDKGRGKKPLRTADEKGAKAELEQTGWTAAVAHDV